jgi:hypothetical protein
MKQGRSLQDLAAEIRRQAESMRDYLVPTSRLTFEASGPRAATIKIPGQDSLSVGEVAHRQIAQRLDIPQKFYDRMLRDHGHVLAYTVNSLWQAGGEMRLIRTLDGRARAYLSDRFHRLDNYDLARAVLPALADRKLAVRSAEITEGRMYLKAVCYEKTMEVRAGDTVAIGVSVTNSEVGLGVAEVAPFLERLVCTNGMRVNEWRHRRAHVGARQETGEGAGYNLLKPDTLEAIDRAYILRVRDLISGVLDGEVLPSVVERMRSAAERKIEGNPVKAVEELGNRFSLSERESGDVLTHLIRGGDLTQYGLVNAVTRSAEDLDSYDRATELEALGYSVLSLPEREWKGVAEAE